MKIGIPTEIKVLEGRVGLIPEAAGELTKRGHEVVIQSGAGLLSGYSDSDYEAVGVKIVPDAETVYGLSEMIIKVKEPVGPELELLQKHHLLFSYLHLAAAPELTRKLQDIGLTGVAFETVEDSAGRLPLLAPMSDIAGRLSVQIGTHLLHMPQGGRGVLLGGLPAAERGNVVIIGGGVAGGNAAVVATSLGANVTVFDRSRDKLEHLRSLGANVTALYPYEHAIREAVEKADLLVGAVLVVGEKAPHIVSEDMVRSMNDGSVIVDISVDQGGCIATTKPTTYESPTFVWEGVTHFGVTNMPGAVPRTASQALSAAIIPYMLKLVEQGWEKDPQLAKGINVRGGDIIHPAVLESLG
ncbi:MAG: alanine dehydrogenase [Gammaproteobacteria bacterium]|nr:alanine dehydrogenase [Gammaproteobacteria bacterium]